MSKQNLNTLALSDVDAMLAKYDTLAADVPVSSDDLATFVTFGTGMRLTVAKIGALILARGIEGADDAKKSLRSYGDAIGVSGSTISTWVTSLTWVRESGAPVTVDNHAGALSLYHSGAAGRKAAPEFVKEVSRKRTDDSKSSAWASAAKRGKAKVETAPVVETREAQPSDGSDIAETTAQTVAALVALAEKFGNADEAHVALSEDQHAVVLLALAQIASAIGAPVTV